MNVIPTLDGGLRLEIEEASDWQALMAISLDAERDLASDLSELMDVEAMWEEIVVPELQEHFTSQIDTVTKAIREAKKTEIAGKDTELHIQKGDAETWYGALNQARLALEDRYQFGAMTEEAFEKIPDPQRQAYFRERFYCHLQSVLIEYVMD